MCQKIPIECFSFFKCRSLIVFFNFVFADKHSIMAFALEKFLFCLELQLGGLIMAWWGMIFSAIGIVVTVIGLISGESAIHRFIPFHFSAGGLWTTGIVGIILLLIYFYFSYQLLLGTQSVSIVSFNQSSRLIKCKIIKRDQKDVWPVE